MKGLYNCYFWGRNNRSNLQPWFVKVVTTMYQAPKYVFPKYVQLRHLTPKFCFYVPGKKICWWQELWQSFLELTFCCLIPPSIPLHSPSHCACRPKPQLETSHPYNEFIFLCSSIAYERPLVLTIHVEDLTYGMKETLRIKLTVTSSFN